MWAALAKGTRSAAVQSSLYSGLVALFLMALPYDAPPHRPPVQPRQQADATTTTIDLQRAAPVFRGLQNLLNGMRFGKGVNPSGRSFLDSLAVLAGGNPSSVDTLPSASHFGGLFHEDDKSIEVRSGLGGQERAATTHEFGHLAELLAPALAAEFDARASPAVQHDLLSSSLEEAQEYGVDPKKETFADAFMMSVGDIVPEIRDPSLGRYQDTYDFTKMMLNASQQRLLDSLVKSRAKLLAK